VPNPAVSLAPTVPALRSWWLSSRVAWTALAVLFCAPTMIPLLAVAEALLNPDMDIWQHLLAHVLPSAVADTLLLMIGVAFGVVIIGVSLAGLVAMTEFPGRRFFEWALLLPLAMPGYVLAVAFLGLFDYSGPVAGALRSVGISELGFRGRTGLTLVLTASLYPYVYLVARQAFASTGLRTVEAARGLGHSPMSAFLRAVLPQGLPWIAAGTSLALMETLADFGTVAAFNYDTLTVAIYKTWYAQFSPRGALQVAAVLLIFVVSLLYFEARARKSMRFVSMGHATARRLALGRSRWLAFTWCGSIFAFAFALPVSWLSVQAARNADVLGGRFLDLSINTLSLASLSAGITVFVALLIALAVSMAPSAWTRLSQRIATLGYAFPGALLAVGLYVPVAAAFGYAGQWGFSQSFVGSGILLLLVGYGVRFLAVGHAPIASGLLRLRPSIVEAARLSGCGTLRIIGGIHLPLLRTSVMTAALLVFVDVMKEMPITLMMRPFGWDTFATRIFEFSREGEWGMAATPSLALMLAGLLPIWLLHHGTSQRAPHGSTRPDNA
jgi:iron(III) transport system permease protein